MKFELIRFGISIPIIFNEWEEMYRKQLGRNALNLLEGIGLIQFESSGFWSDPGQKSSVEYFGKKVILSGSSQGARFTSGKVIFTKVGSELAPICQSKPIEGFFEYVINKWKDLGCIVEPTN